MATQEQEQLNEEIAIALAKIAAEQNGAAWRRVEGWFASITSETATLTLCLWIGENCYGPTMSLRRAQQQKGR